MAQPTCNARTIINSRPPDYTWLRQPSVASATAATPRVNLKSVTWLNNRNQAGWKSLTTWPYYTNRFCARLHTFTRGCTYTHQRDSRALLVVYTGAVSVGRRWMTKRGAYRRKSVIPTRVWRICRQFLRRTVLFVILWPNSASDLSDHDLKRRDSFLPLVTTYPPHQWLPRVLILVDLKCRSMTIHCCKKISMQLGQKAATLFSHNFRDENYPRF